MTLVSINPANGERIHEYEEHSPQAVETALEAAHRAFLEWRGRDFARRGAILRKTALQLREERDPLARLMALEMGKPLDQGRGEIDKCALACEYFADHAERLLEPEPAPSDASRSYVRFDPLGVVLAIMPWNFPFWQVFRFAAPTLMAGNTAVLKHASNVTACALAISDVFRRAGLPDGVFATLLVGSRRVPSLIDSRQVRAVTLTGSTPAGRAVASQSGQKIKKTVLELGGSDAYLVLEDADVPAAAETCVQSRLINSGQSCIAAKRFIVVEAVREEFEHRFVEGMRQRRMGNPLDASTDLGPLARRDLRDALHQQVEATVQAGGRLLLGGLIPAGPGAFYSPTVITGVRRGMAAFDEETFGPVAAIVPARDEEEAVGLANESPFGLGAAVFTRDTVRAERVAAAIEAGSVFVNALVKSDPRLPFGGIKESGYGRELSGFGIREFVNVKTVYVK